MSNKRETAVPGVYEILMTNGQKRLWCGVCKKFLSTIGGGSHDCDPNWRSRLSKGRATSAGGKARRWRMTPKRQGKLQQLLEFAAKYYVILPDIKKIASKQPKWAATKKLTSKSYTRRLKIMMNSLGLK